MNVITTKAVITATTKNGHLRVVSLTNLLTEETGLLPEKLWNVIETGQKSSLLMSRAHWPAGISAVPCGTEKAV